jgi:putative ABC transport system permease protein
MNTLVVSFRNVFRNSRRSLMTVLAISVGAISVVLFGGFVSAILFGLQTNIVQKSGHLHVYRQGYMDFGAGSPADYGIPGYRAVMAAISADPELAGRVRVITPRLTLFGIAGNFAENTSKTFLGMGMVPSDRDRMATWDDYGLMRDAARKSVASGLSDGDVEGGQIGIGLARILRLCGALKIADCPEAPRRETGIASAEAEDFATLAAQENTGADGATRDGRPGIDLLAATAGGAPNVVRLAVNKAEGQGVREIDEVYVGMHLSLAQRLVYGKGEPQVTAIMLQLDHTADMAAVRKRLNALIAERGWDLEVRDFAELAPMYNQVIGMFSAIFTFIAILMGVIVLFTVVNTMTMAVVERTNEIGTLRALGMRRSGVRRLFLTEGWILGLIGATVGVGSGVGIALLINGAGLHWTPPSNVDPIPLSIEVLRNPALLAGCWIGLVLVATLSSLMPANKAARMTVVDALRHI